MNREHPVGRAVHSAPESEPDSPAKSAKRASRNSPPLITRGHWNANLGGTSSESPTLPKGGPRLPAESRRAQAGVTWPSEDTAKAQEFCVPRTAFRPGASGASLSVMHNAPDRRAGDSALCRFAL
jgi:hypothetical protein